MAKATAESGFVPEDAHTSHRREATISRGSHGSCVTEGYEPRLGVGEESAEVTGRGQRCSRPLRSWGASAMSGQY